MFFLPSGTETSHFAHHAHPRGDTASNTKKGQGKEENEDLVSCRNTLIKDRQGKVTRFSATRQKKHLACCSILFSLAKPTRKHRHQEKVVEKS